MELIDKLSKSLAHIEALYMYVNKGSFKNQCIEELEARWSEKGIEAWNEVEKEASKLEPHILIGNLRHEIMKTIEERYGEQLASEIKRRIKLLDPTSLKVIIAFSKMWSRGFKTTDEDELSMALEACLDIRGSKAIEVLWKTGLINRAHRSAVSRYMPKIYIPKYAEKVLLMYSEEPLTLEVNIEDVLTRALAEDPLKACAAVYGVNELIDEMIQVMTGLPIKSIVHKLNIKGLMKAGKLCPLLKEKIVEAWRNVISRMLTSYADKLKRGLKPMGYEAKWTFDDHMKLPMLLCYSGGLKLAVVLMPAILPIKQLRNFSPGVAKAALTLKLNAPPRESIKMLRLSSLIHVEEGKATIYGDEEIDVVRQALEKEGLSIEVH